MASHLRTVFFRAAWLLAAAASSAAAHDTWFQPLGVRAGAALLMLGTGNRFPLHETAVGAEYLQKSGCLDNNGRLLAMTPLQPLPRALLLRAAAGDATTCWAQLPPFEVELVPETVQVYFDEIDAPPEVRAAWAEMHARGVRWRERYTKHARIRLGAGSALPTGMAMDVLLEGGAKSNIRSGDGLVFQVLRDGRPLAGFPVELRGERDAYWHKTDALGRVRLTAPAPGRWLLRGTDLRRSEADRDRWESRFVTLAFEVVPGAGKL